MSVFVTCFLMTKANLLTQFESKYACLPSSGLSLGSVLLIMHVFCEGLCLTSSASLYSLLCILGAVLHIIGPKGNQEWVLYPTSPSGSHFLT